MLTAIYITLFVFFLIIEIFLVLFLRKIYFKLSHIVYQLPDGDYNQLSEIHLSKILKLLKGKKLKKVKKTKPLK